PTPLSRPRPAGDACAWTGRASTKPRSGYSTPTALPSTSPCCPWTRCARRRCRAWTSGRCSAHRLANCATCLPPGKRKPTRCLPRPAERCALFGQQGRRIPGTDHLHPASGADSTDLVAFAREGRLGGIVETDHEQVAAGDRGTALAGCQIGSEVAGGAREFIRLSA